MTVKLINYSQTKEGWNLLDQIAFTARVSNPSNQMNMETSEKLVRYLIKNQHWSPLEMVSVCLEIDTTRDIARQILRHRSFSFQEFSQRYADAYQLGFVTREARLQDTKNRQNSIEMDERKDSDGTPVEDKWKYYQDQITKNVKTYYTWALKNGIAKEQARVILPEGMTKSRMYMNGTLRSWVHYIQLRSANGTQKEHQEIAIACAKAIEPIFPMIKEYTNEQ